MNKLTEWFWDELIETTFVHWSPREKVFFIAWLSMAMFGLGVAFTCLVKAR